MKKNLFVFFLFLLLPISVHAEKIDSFHTKVDILKNGKIKVEERIQYNFESAQKHGIFRFIPTVKTNNDGKKFKLDLNTVIITDESGVDYRWGRVDYDDKVEFKIGDKDKFVTGLHTYVISYEIAGAITYFSDHDELYWNVTGNEWNVVIEKASVDVTLPTVVADTDLRLACYTGASGSTEQKCSLSSTMGRITGSTVIGDASSPLYPQQGYTVVVGFPMNVVAHLEPKPVVNFFDTWYGKLIGMLLGLAVFIWYIGLPFAIPIIWWKNGRDPKTVTGEVRAWFDPPQTQKGRPLTPSETGTLIDESADTRDIFAGIIDLARRGYFRIVEKKKGDFTFIKAADSSKEKEKSVLQPFEKRLIDGLFGTKDEVRLKDKKMATTVEELYEILYKGLTENGFFPHNPNTIRTIWMVIAAFALFTGNFFLAIVAFIFGRVMPRKTAYGAGQANVGKSLKNFLQSQERQLEFQARNQQFFEKLLPFAVAFGVEKVWAERFKDINLQSPDWYQGYDNRAFTTGYLLSSLHSSYSSFRSSATPTRSSSGFSSGFSGGSSGGGGGGGGGGSW